MAMPCALFEPLLLSTTHSSLPRQKIPAFLYGCAWKKERTSDLVYSALSHGFKGIDVAAQPRHYREDLAGEGLRRAIKDDKVKRKDIFVQTKFSPVDAHDPASIPYDPKSPVAKQVETSVLSSLKNLRHEESSEDSSYLDSLVLHSPLPTLSATKEAWKTLESYVPSRIRALGISNTTLPILERLYEEVTVKPAVVQNRFHRETEYDIPLRKFCREKGIVYQSFWTLTANQSLLRHPSVQFLAKAAGTEVPTSLYALCMALEGLVVLNGTASHMKEDLEGLERIRLWASEKDNKYDWENTVKKFKDATGDNNPGPLPVEGTLGKRTLSRDRYA